MAQRSQIPAWQKITYTHEHTSSRIDAMREGLRALSLGDASSELGGRNRFHAALLIFYTGFSKG
jgi:hypothetical protein